MKSPLQSRRRAVCRFAPGVLITSSVSPVSLPLLSGRSPGLAGPPATKLVGGDVLAEVVDPVLVGCGVVPQQPSREQWSQTAEGLVVGRLVSALQQLISPHQQHICQGSQVLEIQNLKILRLVVKQLLNELFLPSRG